MRQHFTISIFILFALYSCNNSTQGQKVDNTKPMYGEVPKTKEIKKIDEDFIQECLKMYGTIDSSVNYHMDLAWRYFYNNDLKSAMKRFNQVWLLNPEFPDSYFGFAALMDMQKNSSAANRFYKIGIEKDKKNQRSEICYQRIADCKENLNDFQGVIEAYTKISEIDPSNSFAFKKIGYFQMQLNNSEEAFNSYNKAIKLDPSDAMTYNNRGYLFQTLKEYSKAITDYSKAIELDSKYISALVNRGICQMETGNFKGAKEDFEICTKLDNNAFELRRFLGLAKLNLNDKDGACKDFRTAKELGDNQINDLIEKNCK